MSLLLGPFRFLFLWVLRILKMGLTYDTYYFKLRSLFGGFGGFCFGFWFFVFVFFGTLLTNLFYRNLKKEKRKKRRSRLIWEEASVNVTNDGNTDDMLGASFKFWNM